MKDLLQHSSYSPLEKQEDRHFTKLLNLLNVNHSLFLNLALISTIAYLIRILRSAHLCSVTPRPLHSKTVKSITELVILQSKKRNIRLFLILKVEHRNLCNGSNFL
jgi:hypothetical protein